MISELSEIDKATLARLASCAKQSESLGFADLYPWNDNEDLHTYKSRIAENGNPGLMFETMSRVFVVESWCYQLRYYAGGWGKDAGVVPAELGIFPSASIALSFAEQYLCGKKPLDSIEAMREVRWKGEGKA
jgi:hypothetical protein